MKDIYIGYYKEYISYYHNSRTHLGLNKDTPKKRIIDPPENGNVIAFPKLGGLQYHYQRRAAYSCRMNKEKRQ